MKDNTTMSYHFIPIRLTEIKHSDIIKSWGGCRVMGNKKNRKTLGIIAHQQESR